MTHQPPVPQAAQSPYPLHPAPLDATSATAVIPSRGTGNVSAPSPLVAQLLGIGAAFVGSAALAAWYFRRDKSPESPTKSRSPENGPAKNRAFDTKRIAAGQPYEVAYFARKHGISVDEARAIIAEAGPSRAKANALATERKG